MKTLELTLNYQTFTPEDSLWVKLVQEGIDDDVATLKETADAIDEVFSIDACSDDGASETPDEEDINEVAEKVFDYTICRADYDGNIEVRVRVVRSNPDLTYNVHVAGGEVLSTESIREEIVLEDFVEGGNSLQLSYPVVNPTSFLWMEDLTSTGDSTIQRVGNTLYWKDQAAGTIQSKFLTAYDVLNIKVYGVDGDAGKATVRVVYQGQIDSLETEIPDAYDTDRSHCGVTFELVDNQTVTCYRTVVKTQKCSCSKEILRTDTYDEVVSCPDYAPKKCQGAATECIHFLGTFAVEEFVECNSDYYLPGTSVRENVSDPDFYEKTCCEKPGVKLPDCEVEILSYKGGHAIQPSENYYRGLYGDRVKFVPVAAEKGCGEHKIKQEFAGNNCCDGVEPLVWNTSVSPEVISPNSAVIIGVTGGGKYPYRWSVSGQGFQFQNGSKSIETTGTQVRFSALVGACGSAIITVTDGCSSCNGTVRCTAGRWEVVGNFRPKNLYYNVIPGTYSCVTNSYSYITTIPSVMYNGMFSMSPDHRGPEYTDPSDLFLGAGAGVHCNSASCPEGFMAVDPLVGMFTWLACTQCHYIGNAAPPYYRMFVTYPLGTNQEFWIHKWVC